MLLLLCQRATKRKCARHQTTPRVPAIGVHGSVVCLSRPGTRFVTVVDVKIEKGRRITLKIDLKVAGGQQLEKSTLEFVQGAGKMLPSLEALLEGLEAGAKRDGVLKAKDAFGNP